MFNFLKAEVFFDYTYKFTLSKDEKASVKIKEIDYPDEIYYFDFSWTLFDQTNIIVHSKYKKYPRQFVMSLRRNLNWVDQTLVPDYKNPHIDRARLILEFSDFKKGEAIFTVYIEDRDKKLEVEFLDPRKATLNQN
ncbi:exporting protein [Campylobacter sp. LMG 7929]|uniref:Exporting protein n=1 Tax=Campylobacter lari TaxID=201 RepID=A0A5L8WCM2_CAMLA|nr:MULTISPECIES: exporting protein [unclassified Campylobacter]EAH4571418.1 exporting protein [Campylobacter lari]MCR8683030.1 exporting protein [Campylobacter sp. LMG 17559]MCR8697647.1 exporting protein [Campylobacter sp. LMG 7929]MCR8704937.1 exporting protein [Campylobacter sp. 2352 PW]EAH6869320.1 exporting protein [Campylobacter lari]